MTFPAIVQVQLDSAEEHDNMSRYDVPRPKRSDHTHRTLSGKWFDERSYNVAVAVWEQGRDEHNSSERASRSHSGAVARGIVSAAITVQGAVAAPQQSDTNTQSNHGQSRLEGQRNRQARSARGATRDKGSRTGESGQQD